MLLVLLFPEQEQQQEQQRRNQDSEADREQPASRPDAELFDVGSGLNRVQRTQSSVAARAGRGPGRHARAIGGRAIFDKGACKPAAGMRSAAAPESDRAGADEAQTRSELDRLGAARCAEFRGGVAQVKAHRRYRQ